MVTPKVHLVSKVWHPSLSGNQDKQIRKEIMLLTWLSNCLPAAATASTEWSSSSSLLFFGWLPSSCSSPTRISFFPKRFFLGPPPYRLLSFLPTQTDLIFFTNITYIVSGEKIVMWRNFTFPCMTIFGKLKISIHVERFQYNWWGFIAIYAVFC